MNTQKNPVGRPAMPERIRLLDAQAKKVERENLVALAELVLAKEVSAEWADMIATVKTRLLAVPARVASRHPGHPAIIATLESELRAAMVSLADDNGGL